MFVYRRVSFFFSRKTARYFGEILWFLYFLFLGGSFLLFLSFQMFFFFQVPDSDLEIFLPWGWGGWGHHKNMKDDSISELISLHVHVAVMTCLVVLSNVCFFAHPLSFQLPKFDIQLPNSMASKKRNIFLPVFLPRFPGVEFPNWSLVNGWWLARWLRSISWRNNSLFKSRDFHKDSKRLSYHTPTWNHPMCFWRS